MKIIRRAPPEFWGLVDVTNNFATEQPQIVAVQVAGFAQQTLSQQVQQERGEHRNNLLAGDDVTLRATPTRRPGRQIRAASSQVWRDYDGTQFFLEFVWHAPGELPTVCVKVEAAPWGCGKHQTISASKSSSPVASSRV